MNYFDERMQKLGITAENNQVMIWRNADKKDDSGNITSGMRCRRDYDLC